MFGAYGLIATSQIFATIRFCQFTRILASDLSNLFVGENRAYCMVSPLVTYLVNKWYWYTLQLHREVFRDLMPWGGDRT